MTAHLAGLLNAIDVQDGWRNVIHRSFKSHQPQIMLDAGAHGKKRTRDVVAIGKVMLRDDWRGFLVVHVRMRVGLFELAQRLDAVVGNDDDVGILVRVLQDCAQHFIEGNVLVGERLRAHRIDLGVVARIVRRDGIKPMPGPVFARLRQAR